MREDAEKGIPERLWNSGGEASEEKILVGGKRRWVAGRRKEYIKSKETPDLRVNTRGNQRKSMKIMENTLPLLVASGYSVVKGGEGGARWKSEVARCHRCSLTRFSHHVFGFLAKPQPLTDLKSLYQLPFELD
jgi:hypothetical protein